MSLRTFLAVALAAGPAPPSGQASRFRPLPDDGAPPVATPAAGIGATAGTRSLPYARGRRFASLDAYLAFRREQGAIDLPWYEEVEPGVYLLRTSLRPQPAPRRFTRAELARRYGFDR